MMEKEVRYGNWVSNRLVGSCLTIGFVCALLAVIIFIVWDNAALGIVFSFLSTLFLASMVYFIRARYLFSDEGGGIQNKVIDMLVNHINFDGNGEALDIGCGSGSLTIKTAKKFTNARVTGIDYWGKAWEYSQKQCEINAEAESVNDRTAFLRASASKLPFADESFDLSVSNLVFHEVKDTRNKCDLIREALRVVKKGGVFVFQDLFRIKQYYGSIEDLLAALKEAGISEIHYKDTSNTPFIPKLLKLPFMIGTMGIIYGVK